MLFQVETFPENEACVLVRNVGENLEFHTTQRAAMELFTSVGQVCLFVYLFIYLMAL
jgi:hypothetical protein